MNQLDFVVQLVLAIPGTCEHRAACLQLKAQSQWHATSSIDLPTTRIAGIATK
jgi:hypothetical protein